MKFFQEAFLVELEQMQPIVLEMFPETENCPLNASRGCPCFLTLLGLALPPQRAPSIATPLCSLCLFEGNLWPLVLW